MIVYTVVAQAQPQTPKRSQMSFIITCRCTRSCLTVGATNAQLMPFSDKPLANLHQCARQHRCFSPCATRTRTRSRQASLSEVGTKRLARAYTTSPSEAVSSNSHGLSEVRSGIMTFWIVSIDRGGQALDRRMCMATVTQHIRTAGAAMRPSTLSRTVCPSSSVPPHRSS
jgi:hypothetical protein